MAINLIGSSFSCKELDTNSFSFIIDSSASIAIICIDYLPILSQEISSVKINGLDANLIETAQQDISIATSAWYLQNISSGTNNVLITFDNSVKSSVSCLIYDGVNLQTPIYNSRSGVGKNISQMPIKSFSKISGLAIGFGSVNNEISHVEQLYGNQFKIYSNIYSGNSISSEAIAASGLYNMDYISVPNTLNYPADWAISIIGLEAK